MPSRSTSYHTSDSRSTSRIADLEAERAEIHAEQDRIDESLLQLARETTLSETRDRIHRHVAESRQPSRTSHSHRSRDTARRESSRTHHDSSFSSRTGIPRTATHGSRASALGSDWTPPQPSSSQNLRHTGRLGRMSAIAEESSSSSSRTLRASDSKALVPYQSAGLHRSNTARESSSRAGQLQLVRSSSRSRHDSIVPTHRTSGKSIAPHSGTAIMGASRGSLVPGSHRSAEICIEHRGDSHGNEELEVHIRLRRSAR